MTRLSDKLLSEANQRVVDFERAIEKVSKKYGASWEDVVIHFEWNTELQAILANPEFSSEVKSAVKAAVETNLSQYGMFDKNTVQKWVKDGQKGKFDDFVTESQSTYRRDVVSERLNKL